MKPLPTSHLRIARPSHDLWASERFWVDGLGLEVLFRADSSAEGGHGDGEFESWLDVVAEGFAHPDTQGVPSHEEFPREVIARAERDFAAAGVTRYIALRDGIIAGGASLRVAEGVAQLTGAATATAHRRRGIQTALLSARLADAAAVGCDVAVVTTQPASKSQQNVQRRGFDLLYTRAVLVKQP